MNVGTTVERGTGLGILGLREISALVAELEERNVDLEDPGRAARIGELVRQVNPALLWVVEWLLEGLARVQDRGALGRDAGKLAGSLNAVALASRTLYTLAGGEQAPAA